MKLILMTCLKFFSVLIGVLLISTLVGYFFSQGAASLVTGVPILLVALLLYFLPAYFAHKRKQPNAQAITILNLLLGWTMIGWIAALVWAFTNPGTQDAKARSASAGS